MTCPLTLSGCVDRQDVRVPWSGAPGGAALGIHMDLEDISIGGNGWWCLQPAPEPRENFKPHAGVPVTSLTPTASLNQEDLGAALQGPTAVQLLHQRLWLYLLPVSS